MSVLPQVSGREVVAALMKRGYEKDRQRGSHIILRQVIYPHLQKGVGFPIFRGCKDNMAKVDGEDLRLYV